MVTITHTAHSLYLCVAVTLTQTYAALGSPRLNMRGGRDTQAGLDPSLAGHIGHLARLT